MSDDLAEKVAAVLGEHARVERFTKPARRKGITEWGKRCICGEEMPWENDPADVAHRAHLAAALLPLIREREAAAWERALREAAAEMPRGTKSDMSYWDGVAVRYTGYEESPEDRTPHAWLRDRAAANPYAGSEGDDE